MSQVPWNINQCITIFFDKNKQAVQKYSLLIHFVISDCSQEMLITMPPQANAMIAMLWLLKISKKFFALHVVTAGPEHLAVDCLDFPKSSLDPHCPVRFLIGRIFCPFQPSPFFEDFCNHVCRKLTVMRKSLFAGVLMEKCSLADIFEQALKSKMLAEGHLSVAPMIWFLGCLRVSLKSGPDDNTCF